jgi:hypothetical protein
MVLTVEERKARRKAGVDDMSEARKITRDLMNGRPPSSELRTPTEAITAARVLYRELEERMTAAKLAPKLGDWTVKIAYVSADFSILGALTFSPGKESELLAKLTKTPVIVFGLIFGVLDKAAKDARNVIAGARPFLVTKQTVGWLNELRTRAHEGLN